MSKFSSTLGKYFLGAMVATLVADGFNNSDIRKQIGKIKQDISNTGISNKNFTQLENRLGNAPLLDAPSNSAVTAAKWQATFDAIKLEGAVKKAYLEGAQAVRDSVAKASKVASKL